MDDSGAILSHISSLKDMLDQVLFIFGIIVRSLFRNSKSKAFFIKNLKQFKFFQINEEIEANIQITSDIESEIVKCTEIETTLAVKESELTKMLFISQFEIIGFQSVTGNFVIHFFSKSFNYYQKILGDFKELFN